MKGNPVSVRLFEGEIRRPFVFSGKNDELTPDFSELTPDFSELTPDFCPGFLPSLPDAWVGNHPGLLGLRPLTRRPLCGTPLMAAPPHP